MAHRPLKNHYDFGDDQNHVTFGLGIVMVGRGHCPTPHVMGLCYQAFIYNYNICYISHLGGGMRSTVGVILHNSTDWLHCALASGAVYCKRSYLCVFVAGGRVGGVCYHNNSKLRPSIFTKLGLHGAASDHLQLIKCWRSCSLRKGVCGGGNFGSALLQPSRTLCVYGDCGGRAVFASL